MKGKKLFLILVLFLCGCAGKSSSSVSSSSSVQSSAEENVSEAYTGLKKDNAFYYGEEDALVNFIQNGTGVVFIGNPAKDNSQKYIVYLNDVLAQNNLQAAVFDSDDLEKNEERKNQIADLLKKESDDSLVVKQEDGTDLLDGPLVLFLNDGKVTAWDSETNGMDDVSAYWNADRVNALKKKLDEAASATKEAQKNSQNTGCEKACTFGGD